MLKSINQPWAISDKIANRYGNTWTNLDFVFDCKKASVPRDTNDLISENISSGTEHKSQTVTATNNSNKSQVNQNLPTKKNKTWLYVLLGATALFGIYYFYQKKKILNYWVLRKNLLIII